MIRLVRVGGDEIYMNEDYIEHIEPASGADTTIKIHDGTTFTVEEKPEQILDLIRKWRHSLVPVDEKDINNG